MTNAALDLLFDTHRNEFVQPNDLPLISGNQWARVVAELAYQSMLMEIYHTPKPGLVDLVNNGAHSDMDVPLFEMSANSIQPYLDSFVLAGFSHKNQPAHSLLSVLRPIGIDAEKAMFKATSGVNTHKGMIFGIGLICGAIGWLVGKKLTIDALYISKVIKECCQLLVVHELKQRTHSTPQSNGERLYQEYGLTGARGEAASGYETVMRFSLPTFEAVTKDGYSNEEAFRQTLLVTMAHNQDSNIVNRAGLYGLYFVQNEALKLLKKGGVTHFDIKKELSDLDQIFIQKHISPGGSADLLAITWLLAQINQLNQHAIESNIFLNQ